MSKTMEKYQIILEGPHAILMASTVLKLGDGSLSVLKSVIKSGKPTEIGREAYENLKYEYGIAERPVQRRGKTVVEAVTLSKAIGRRKNRVLAQNLRAYGIAALTKNKTKPGYEIPRYGAIKANLTPEIIGSLGFAKGTPEQCEAAVEKGATFTSLLNDDQVSLIQNAKALQQAVAFVAADGKIVVTLVDSLVYGKRGMKAGTKTQ